MGVFQSTLQQSVFIPAPKLTEENLPDQFGKIFIVTGSNTGIGYQLAKLLYAANSTVYIAARNESKANAAIKSITAAYPSSKGALQFLKLDLSDLSTIQASADDFLSKEYRLDVLWNNAGVMVPPKGSRSAQGYELQYATNILGPFLFTKFLTPILKRTAETAPRGTVRVSWAGSVGLDLGSPKPGGVLFNEDGSLQDVKEGDQETAYSITKAANYLLGHEYGKQNEGSGILSNSFNPGNLKSDLQRHLRTPIGDMIFLFLDRLLYKPIYGAYTELYAGLSDDLTIEKHQGAYIWPWGRLGRPRQDIQDEARKGGKSQKLWKWCERETGKFVFADIKATNG